MKLLIDISDDLYEKLHKSTEDWACCYVEGWQKTIAQTIRNGKPYEERPQDELAEKLKDRIEKSVCKYCQMNKHCELCKISCVFQIITLTAEEQKGGAE